MVGSLRLRRAPPGNAAFLLLQWRPPHAAGGPRRARPRGSRAPGGALGGRRASRTERRRARRGRQGSSTYLSCRRPRETLVKRARRSGRGGGTRPWRRARGVFGGGTARLRGCRLGGWRGPRGRRVCRSLLRLARRARQCRRRLTCAGERRLRIACTEQPQPEFPAAQASQRMGSAGRTEAPGERTLDARLPVAQALADSQEDAALAAAARRRQHSLASAHIGRSLCIPVQHYVR